MQQNLDGLKLRGIVEKALSTVVKRFKTVASKFQICLSNFEQNQYLKSLINELYERSVDLNITRADIRDLLTELGGEDYIKKGFGMEYYKLWFEFVVMDEGSFKERIKEQEILDFPTEKKKQLEALKQICLACTQNYLVNTEQTILTALESDQLFQQFLTLKEKQKKNGKSDVKDEGSIRKSTIKKLQTDKVALIFMQVLENIGKKIGIISKISNFTSTREKLKDYIDNVLLSPENLEHQIITINLKEVLLSILGIELKKSICRLIDQTEDTIKEGFEIFGEFYRLSDATIQCKNSKMAVEDYFQYISKRLYSGKPYLWYWPTFDGKSLISFLIATAIESQKRVNWLVENMNKYPPNLESKINNPEGRAFLEELLNELPRQGPIAPILRCVSRLVQKQRVDIQRQLPTGEHTYYSLLRGRGVPVDRLEQISLLEQNDNNRFYILCNKTRAKQFLPLTPQHVAELISKTKDSKFYGQERFEYKDYLLTVTMTNQICLGRFVSGSSGAYKKEVKFEGILNYGNLYEFGNSIKNFTWKVVSIDQWKEYQFTQNESQQISEKIYNSRKGAEASISMKLSQQNLLLEINCENWNVKELFHDEKVSQSSFIKKFGFLAYTPSHKNKSAIGQQEETQIEDNPYPPLEDDIDTPQPPPEIHSFAQVFEFLGVFRPFFDIDEGYFIDENKNIVTENRNIIQYLKNWEEVQLYRSIDDCLIDKSAKINKNRKINNLFIINRKIYGSMVRQLRMIENKLKKIIQVGPFDQKLSQIEIINLKEDEQSHEFFVALFEYLSLKIAKNNQVEKFRIPLSPYEMGIINDIMPKDTKIVGTSKESVVVEGSKEDKKKLLESLQALDQIQDFTYEHPDAYQLMKKIFDDRLKEMKVVDLDIGEELFKVQMRLKDHAQFREMLQHCYNMIQQKPGELKQIKISEQAQFLHIYRSQMLKVDAQIMVSKLNSDVLIQFNSKLQKRVNDALVKIKEAKDKQFFKYMKKSSIQHVFRNLPHQLLFQLKQKSEKILQKSAKMGLKPRIDLNMTNNSEIMLKAEQISPEQQQQFNKLMEYFRNRCEQLEKIKAKINDTNKYVTKATNKLPKKKKQSLALNKFIEGFTKFLQTEIIKIIDEVTKNRLTQLENEFFNYIKNQELESPFISKQAEQSAQEIEKRISELNPFGRQFITIFIEQLSEELKTKPLYSSVEKMMKEMEPIVKSTSQKYNANTLNAQQLERYFKSLNILGRIYLGQQLPITQHLQTFKDKLNSNDVVMVKVGTGSGKSTVIPPYLIGLGYEKVVVTQPRRLPCREIYKRINSVFGEGISGYEVGDGSKDEQNRLIYMTDGLLKTRALFKMEEIFDKIDVLMIDQIHERSANIDMLLLLLHVYFKLTKRKMKLVLCSATIDTKIGELLKEAGLKVDTFFVETNRHAVTEYAITEGTIIDKILQLNKKLQSDEQMLIFYPGVKEVNDTVNILLQKYNRIAYAITANQNPKDQQNYLQKGSIFVATAIAQTSLTFRKLKYVIDSRMSRSRAFNSELQIMETEESYSSKSSIQQRKGRLGRTCPGEYYYMVYAGYDDQNTKEHNPTELEKIDLTAYVFELLLMQGSNFNNVSLLLAKLKHEQVEFNKKIQYSRGILQDLCVLRTNGTLQNTAVKLIKYGNLGNPQHNYAIYQGSLANCQVNIIYLTSFFMVASNLSGEILKYIKTLYKGGDIKIIHDFIAKIADDISLRTLKNNQIMNTMKRNCPYIANKSWFMTIFRVIKKVKQLFSSCIDFVPSTDWKTVTKILIHAYRNKLFFNQSIFGANKNLFQKMRSNTTFNFEERQQYKVMYKMDMNSALYQKDNLPRLILSLNSAISPDNECVLSVCEEIDPNEVNEDIKIAIIGTECNQKYFVGTMPILEQEVLNQLENEVRSNYNRIKVDNAFPKVTFTGNFKEIANAFGSFIEPKRRNPEIKFKLNTILQQAIDKRAQRAKKDLMMPTISPELTKSMLEKLTNYDFKTMFQTTKFEMSNDFGVEIQWDAQKYQANLIAKKVKNIHVAKLLLKLVSFFRWFADSQIICKEEFKIKPRHIEDGRFLTKDVRDKIVSRINNIVDSRIEPYIIKGWVNGKGASTQYPRTARMIAVSWVLTNVFGCVIKGGFVRDWVVNGEEKLPAGDLTKLLQKNPRNEYLQVVDDTITPSDIDAQLSSYVLFDEEKFKKEMSKLGITVTIEEDGWRKHIIFDQHAVTGGFTADLIETYTSMCHDTYDFDVNTLYLKKDNLNSIGQKIPLEFEGKKQKIELEELLASCRRKQMKKLKQNIWKHRLEKFKDKRGWKIIENQVYTPIVYKSYITQSSPVPPEQIKSVSPVFLQEMVNKRNARVVKIESLSNKAWDDAFEATEHWIIAELERAEKIADPINYSSKRINSNSKMLFHGSKTLGIQGIKQSGFDSRFFNAVGFYGRGAYFADDPELSDRFTQKNSDGLKQMFVVKVALGKQEVLKVAANNKLGPSKGYHSILGQAGGHNQYIIQRFGQAKPMYLITYR